MHATKSCDLVIGLHLLREICGLLQLPLRLLRQRLVLVAPVSERPHGVDVERVLPLAHDVRLHLVEGGPEAGTE